MTAWLDAFQSLTVGGKIAFISGHILVILLIMLWEMHAAHSHDAKRLITAEHAEKLVHTVQTSPKNDDIQNVHSGVRYLLDKFCNNLRKPPFYYQSGDDGDNPPCHLQSQRHIRIIVDWLRKRVNQSGKEPNYSSLNFLL